MAEQAILLVEDEAGLRDLYEEALKKAGFLVFAVGNGEEAVGVLQNHDLAAAVLDVMLPGISGLDVLAKMRADAKTKTTPVMMLSALEDTDDRARGLSLGASVYFSKTELDPDSLPGKITQLISGSHGGEPNHPPSGG